MGGADEKTVACFTKRWVSHSNRCRPTQIHFFSSTNLNHYFRVSFPVEVLENRACYLCQEGVISYASMFSSNSFMRSKSSHPLCYSPPLIKLFQEPGDVLLTFPGLLSLNVSSTVPSRASPLSIAVIQGV